MHSLAHLVILLLVLAALAGSAIGCGIGWFISKRFGLSKIGCMLGGAIAGLPAGFFLFPMVLKFINSAVG